MNHVPTADPQTAARWSGADRGEVAEEAEELAAALLPELRKIAKGPGLMSPQRLQKCERLMWLAGQLGGGDAQRSSPVGRLSAAVKQVTADWPDQERELVLMTLGIEGSSGQTLQARRTAYSNRWPGCEMTIYRAQLVVYEQLAAALAVQWASERDSAERGDCSAESTRLLYDEDFSSHMSEPELRFARSATVMIEMAAPLADLLGIYRVAPAGALTDLSDHPRALIYESLLRFVLLTNERMSHGYLVMADWSKSLGLFHHRPRAAYEKQFGSGLSPLCELEVRHLAQDIDVQEDDDQMLLDFARTLHRDSLAARCLDSWQQFLNSCHCERAGDVDEAPHDAVCDVGRLRSEIAIFDEQLHRALRALEAVVQRRIKAASKEDRPNVPRQRSPGLSSF